VAELLALRQHKIRVKIKKIAGWRGWPDRLALFDGGVADWLEVKRPVGGKFEPLQLRTHDMLRGMGFTVVVVNTRELVDDYIHWVISRACT